MKETRNNRRVVITADGGVRTGFDAVKHANTLEDIKETILIRDSHPRTTKSVKY